LVLGWRSFFHDLLGELKKIDLLFQISSFSRAQQLDCGGLLQDSQLFSLFISFLNFKGRQIYFEFILRVFHSKKLSDWLIGEY